VRVLLSDEGEGWRSDAPSVVPGQVIGEAVSASGQTIRRVQFDAPIGLQASPRSLFSRWKRAAQVGAWVMPRVHGQEFSARAPISVHVWFVAEETGWGEAPSEQPALKARCTVLG